MISIIIVIIIIIIISSSSVIIITIVSFNKFGSTGIFFLNEP